MTTAPAPAIWPSTRKHVASMSTRRTPSGYAFRVLCPCGFDATTNYRDDAQALVVDHNREAK